MSIAVTCPCGRNIFVRHELAGKHIRCPACRETVLIPSDEPVEEVPPSHVSAELKVRKPVPGRTRKAIVLMGIGSGVLVGASFMIYFLVFAKAKKEEEKNITAPSPPAYNGHLDHATHQTITGWAWDKNQPNTPVAVDIYDGDTLLGTVKADQLRKDLVKAGIGDGKHAFIFRTPAGLKDQESHSLWGKVSGTDLKLNPKNGIPLSGSPK